MIYYVILLVILSNNVLLSPPITFTYHFISISLYSWYIKFYLSIIKNWLFCIALLRNTLTVIILC